MYAPFSLIHLFFIDGSLNYRLNPLSSGQIAILEVGTSDQEKKWVKNPLLLQHVI
jgi:hypothetical protein